MIVSAGSRPGDRQWSPAGAGWAGMIARNGLNDQGRLTLVLSLSPCLGAGASYHSPLPVYNYISVNRHFTPGEDMRTNTARSWPFSTIFIAMLATIIPPHTASSIGSSSDTEAELEGKAKVREGGIRADVVNASP